MIFFLHILRRLAGCENQRLCSPWPPGNRGRNPDTPRIAFRGRPGRPGHRPRVLLSHSNGRSAPRAAGAGAGAAPPQNPPPRPASGSHRLPNTLGQAGEQYGPSIAPFARARCPLSPLLRPHSPGGAARGSHTGQFSCFGPRSCFIAFVLDIPNGLQTLDRAVGRAYIRERTPT